MEENKVTEELIDIWCGGSMFNSPYEMLRSWVVDILNKEYDLDTAIENVLSFREN